MLEKRASEYRRIGKLFGMEKVQPTFQWSKFWLSFLATGELNLLMSLTKPPKQFAVVLVLALLPRPQGTLTKPPHVT